MKNEHYYNLIEAFDAIDDDIKQILDAGSGKSSLYTLTEYYKTNIDAIVYPGDNRKINSIKTNINNEFTLIESDICENNIAKKYDLVLAHLLLGEAATWNNSFELLLHKLLNIKSKYYIIYDYLEDINVDYKLIEKYLSQNNFKIILKKCFKKEQEQEFKDFIGKNYICYVIKSNE